MLLAVCFLPYLDGSTDKDLETPRRESPKLCQSLGLFLLTQPGLLRRFLCVNRRNVSILPSLPHRPISFDPTFLVPRASLVFPLTPTMSNAPSRRRVSQTQPSAESWHSVPSHHSTPPSASNGNNSARADDRAGSPEVIVDLTDSIAHDHGRDSDAAAYLVGSGEKKKCWICLVEEGEQFPDGNPINTSRWAKACACSLDAHESCLITWINQSRGADASKTVFPPPHPFCLSFG